MQSRIFLLNSVLCCFLLFAFVSCVSSKMLSSKEQKQLHELVTESSVLSQGFTGFQLYDPVSKQILYQQYADRYFTPASNTKIFTFYVANHLLQDSVPALKYIAKNDSLIFWGTGDPSLLHNHLPNNSDVLAFLRNRPEKLFFCADNFMDTRYGAGWMWDDYPYSFQVERSPLPIYGNVVSITKGEEEATFTISPNYFQAKIKEQDIGGANARFLRQEKSNEIDYNGKPAGTAKFDRELPFIYSDSLAAILLGHAIGRPVQLITGLGIQPKESKTLYSISKDSINQRMMVESDNFLADQLLYLSSGVIFDTLNTRMIIRYAKDSLFNDAPDPLMWYDGSGLTRYNQFTPRTMVYLLEKIYQEMPESYWKTMFPAGGETGTIQEYFSSSQPYIYAKTGSMRYVRCLSGYLLTERGNTLIFSFMNNHIPGSSSTWALEMEQILFWLYKRL